MDLKFAWIFAFVVVLVSFNIVHHLIRKSIRQKPLGYQTIYDAALQGPALNIFLGGRHCYCSSIKIRVCIFQLKITMSTK